MSSVGAADRSGSVSPASATLIAPALTLETSLHRSAARTLAQRSSLSASSSFGRSPPRCRHRLRLPLALERTSRVGRAHLGRCALRTRTGLELWRVHADVLGVARGTALVPDPVPEGHPCPRAAVRAGSGCCDVRGVCGACRRGVCRA